MDPTKLQFWAVLGTWVASIGTVAAVITSLWFAFHQNRIKLKVSAGHRILITTASRETPDYCCINVVNVGLRPAKISNVSWQVGRGRKKKRFIQTFGYPGFDDIPKTLQEGEAANFMIPFVSSGGGKDWIIDFAKDLVGKDSSVLIKSLKVYVHTSVGQSFKSKAEKDLIEKLEDAYNANKDIKTDTT
jgi:hypothetical protein